MTNINNAEFKTASEAYNWLFPKILFDGIMQPGRFSFTRDATIYPTGVYFVKAISKNQKQVKKIMLIK